jgi:hypothetical protein
MFCQIIQALKRLKSSSTDERGRMTEETQRMFDELTEAAMKLMENGEYSMCSFLFKFSSWQFFGHPLTISVWRYVLIIT